MTPVRKHKLIIDGDHGDCFLGMAIAEPDYRVSLLLNNSLGIKLKSVDPVVAEQSNNSVSFSRFYSVSRFNNTCYDLISNRSSSHKLIPKLPKIDYLLRISGEDSLELVEMIMRKIRSIEEITGVFLLDNDLIYENKIQQLIP